MVAGSLAVQKRLVADACKDDKLLRSLCRLNIDTLCPALKTGMSISKKHKDRVAWGLPRSYLPFSCFSQRPTTVATGKV